MIYCNNSYSEILDEYYKKSNKKLPKQKEYSKGKEKKKDYSKDRDRKRNYE